MAECRDFPPGFDAWIWLRIPRRHRADAVQEAWLAYLDGKSPNTAARNYLTRERLFEVRHWTISQLTETQRRAYGKALDKGGCRREHPPK